MNREKTTTVFAPAERAADSEIARQARLFAGLPHLPTLFDAVSAVVFIVNAQRQIVFANDACARLLGVKDAASVYGMRPGEAVQCEHAEEMPGGCGTSEPCKVCGAVNAVLASQRGRRDTRECRITRKNDGEALDLLVWATPLSLDGETFSIVALADISHEKRRRALERIFFHDILNAVGAVQGMAAVLREVGAQEMEEFRERIYQLARNLEEEIEWHRALTQAENNELEPKRMALSSREVLRELVHTFSNHPIANQRHVVLDPQTGDSTFISDPVLIRRILGNLIKNALEAAEPGQTVTLRSEIEEDTVTFAVHNAAFMPRDVQLQIFQRSFSTKGTGRGLGTYSVKLLSERYLGGNVRFTTSPDEGTTFFARYPLMPGD